MVHEDGAVTSNQTLIQWLPAQSSIATLLASRRRSTDAAAFGDESRRNPCRLSKLC